jgi:hypothetical protein
MRRHEVRVTNSASAKNEAQLFKVTQHSKVLTREDDSTGPHEMRTFHISAGAAKDDPNTFHGTYFPMTAREQGWDEGGSGQQFQPESATITRQQSAMALTTPLSGCFVTDGPEGIGHMQPYKAPSVNPRTTSVQQEAQHYQRHNANAGQILTPQHSDIFGPTEYGKYDKPKGRDFRVATAIVMADDTGQKHIMSQSVYGNNYGSSPEDQTIRFNTRPFGAPPTQHRIEIDPVAPLLEEPPQQMNNRFLTPPATPHPMQRRDPRPLPERRRSHADILTSAPKFENATKAQQRGRANSTP